MKRRVKALTAVTAALVVSACEHPVSQQKWDTLVSDLTGWSKDWSGSVFNWQNRTFQTICEIAAFADSTPEDHSDIGEATQAYCGPGDGGTPSEPPDWGRG